jgi:hypothetical protein
MEKQKQKCHNVGKYCIICVGITQHWWNDEKKYISNHIVYNEIYYVAPCFEYCYC